MDKAEAPDLSLEQLKQHYDQSSERMRECMAAMDYYKDRAEKEYGVNIAHEKHFKHLLNYHISYDRGDNIKLGQSAVNQLIEQIVGQPVWDHPTEKDTQIGMVTEATNELENERIKVTFEIFPQFKERYIHQSGLSGLSLGGTKQFKFKKSAMGPWDQELDEEDP